MKRLAICIAAAAAVAAGTAQTLHIENGSVSYSYPAASAGVMDFGTDAGTLTVRGVAHVVNETTLMWVDDAAPDDNVVTVTYSGATARVDIAGNIARYVTAAVDGAHVTVTQSADVSDSTCGEITYRLSGETSDGSFCLEGSYKSSLELTGLSLTSTRGAALNIDNGKRISLSVKSGSVNTLADGVSGSQKGCIVCKGHLELKGKGELTLCGNASHAIYAKEYVEMKNCTVNVTGAVKDGVNCNQYFLMESGTLNITGVGDDGIQVSFKDSADREAEDTGSVTLEGGNLTIEVTADAAKGMKCEGPMNILGGALDITVKGNGIWDSDKNKTKASACLGSDGDMTISGGTILLTATGSGGKGINADGSLTIDDGTLSIKTSGGVTAYVNGSLQNNYTGSTDRLASDYKSSPKGIKADGDVTVNAGTVDVVTAGNGAEGIESKSVLTINGGDVTVKATDDAINSGSHMYIKGGSVTVISTGNDGLDSNGNLYIQGGYVMAFGSGSPECGLDANEESGYTVVFSGGTVLAVGGGNSVPSASSGSTQAYVSASAAVAADAVLTLADGAGTELATFTVPADYVSSASGNPGFGGGRPGGGPGGNAGNSVLVTCPGLVSGQTYTLKTGTSGSSVTARMSGSSGWRP